MSTKWGLLKGMDRSIRTVARSGEVIFARADTPDQAAYDVAKAVDQARGDLIYLIRRYSIDPRTVAENQGVPLHPGARATTASWATSSEARASWCAMLCMAPHAVDIQPR